KHHLKPVNKRNRMVALNRYYKITKFYDFLKSTAIKGGITIAVVLALFVFLEYYFLDTRAMLDALVNNYSRESILGVFYISETILGLLPPEIFIAWSAKMSHPWIYLSVLATLSYLGGITAYYLGTLT